MKTTQRLGVLLAAVLFTIAPLSVFAADIQTGKTVSVPATQMVAGNAYLAGGQVLFSTTAQKDLIAAGGEITVNGPVWGDAMLAGGTIQVLQPIKGDVRAVGGQITIGSSVAGDVVVGGGKVTILPGAVIGGDVIVAGGTVDVEGTVNGSLNTYGGDVTLNGLVAGPVSIKAGKTVTFGEKTVIASTLAYSAQSEATVVSGAKLGDHVTFTKGGMPNVSHRSVAAIALTILGILVFAKFIGILAAALVLVFVFKTFSQTLAERTLAHFWKKVLVGFVTLVVTPVAIILLVISFIGLYLAFFLFALYILMLVIAGVFMGVIAGAFLSRWLKKQAIVDWKWTLLGTLAVFLLAFVPVIGWIIDLLLFFAALGAIVLSVHRDAQEKM